MPRWIPAVAGAFGLMLSAQLASAAQQINCSKSIDRAQEAIEKITGDLHGMEKMMAKSELVEIHALLDDAKMLLVGARHNCEQPQGPFDLARAIAKADSARGHAVAADILHFHYMQHMGSRMGAGAMKGMQGKP